MNADTTQGGDTTVVDTTVVDTTRISPVVDKFTHLFPNPATEYAVVCSSFPMRSVALYDPSGRCVMRRRVEGTTAQIEVTGYAAGVYYLEIRTPAGRTVKRLMIQ